MRQKPILFEELFDLIFTGGHPLIGYALICFFVTVIWINFYSLSKLSRINNSKERPIQISSFSSFAVFFVHSAEWNRSEKHEFDNWHVAFGFLKPSEIPVPDLISARIGPVLGNIALN